MRTTLRSFIAVVPCTSSASCVAYSSVEKSDKEIYLSLGRSTV